MTTILAHRANLKGPRSVAENSLAACADAFRPPALDWRRICGAMPCGRVLHQPRSASAYAGKPVWHATRKLFRQHLSIAELAINVKEARIYEPGYN